MHNANGVQPETLEISNNLTETKKREEINHIGDIGGFRAGNNKGSWLDTEAVCKLWHREEQI